MKQDWMPSLLVTSYYHETAP